MICELLWHLIGLQKGVKVATRTMMDFMPQRWLRPDVDEEAAAERMEATAGQVADAMVMRR